MTARLDEASRQATLAHASKDPWKIHQAEARVRRFRDLLANWKQPVADSPIQIQIEVWRIGNVGIVSMPGEPFAEIGVAIRNASPFDFTMFCGYSDGVVAAMVSEVLRLTYDERLRLTDDLVAISADRGVVVTSVGAESSKQATILARHAQVSGCHAVMAIPPISTSLPEDQLWRYFCEIADSTELPLIVQDASSYVGSAMSIGLFVRLLERFGEDKILFKPEAAPIGPNLSALRDQTNGRARIFDGSGGILLIDAYRRGIVGTIPGTDLLDGIVALWRALKRGDEPTAYRLYFPICAIVNLQLQAGLDGFLAIEKYLMVKRGLFNNDSRRPPFAWQIDAETRDEVDRLFAMLMSMLEERGRKDG